MDVLLAREWTTLSHTGTASLTFAIVFTRFINHARGPWQSCPVSLSVRKCDDSLLLSKRRPIWQLDPVQRWCRLFLVTKKKKKKKKTLNTIAYSIRGRSISIEPGIEQWQLLRTFFSNLYCYFRVCWKNGHRTPWGHKTMYLLIIRWFLSFGIINSWNL